MLQAGSRRWMFGKGLMRLVQVTARHLGVTLPPETDVLFSDFESKIWSSQDREKLSSFYPNLAVSAGAFQDDEKELDRFLEKWDGLSISEQSQREQATK